MYKKIVIGLLCLLNFACVSSPERERPVWIENPGLGAVGGSPTHIKGRYYQEELAIARARERLAARYGISISSTHDIEETVKNDVAYISSYKTIKQEIKNKIVRARVRKIWHDTDSDELWVWLYPIQGR